MEVQYLPLPPSDFIGRQAELAVLRRMLDAGRRLITLTGPGGVGKTRLALELCAQVQETFPGPVRFIPLQALSESDQVLSALAAALDVRETGRGSLMDDLVAALAAPALLCIDNWEHLLDAAPQVARLLSACPGLRVLATSREALRLQGEQEFAIAPLGVSVGGTGDAVALFASRAAAVRRGFTLTTETTLIVARTCALLDGLPLAIELGAALMRLFSPQALLARLEGAPGFAGRAPTLQLLAGGPRDLPARQQTLNDAIAWSYDLLEPAEQRVFRRLAVFAGGCDLAAAEAVCADPAAARPVLDSLLALVDKNLLRVEEVEGEPRFDMLRTIQDYAFEQLHGNGETQDLGLRHMLTYLELVERAIPELKGDAQTVWLKRLDRERENLTAAIQRALGQQRPDLAFRIAGELWHYWNMRGYNKEADRWFGRLLATEADVSPELRAKVLNGAGAVAWSLGDLDRARAHHTECLALRMRLEDGAGIAASNHNLGIVAHDQLDLDAAEAYFQAGIAGYQELGDLWGAGDGLLQLGSVLRKKKAYDEARMSLQQGLSVLTDLGDKYGVAGAHYLLAELARSTGDVDGAHFSLAQCKRICAEVDYTWLLALVDHELGLMALREGDLDKAEPLLVASLRQKQELGDQTGLAHSLEALACLAIAHKNVPRAAQLWGAAEALRNKSGAPLDNEERALYEPYLASARSQWQQKSAIVAQEAGRRMSLGEAVAFALEPSETVLHARRRSGGYPAGLTGREVEVLLLVAQGLTDAEVADKLILSPRTVNAHLTSIYNKLGVNSRAAATRFAVEHKLA